MWSTLKKLNVSSKTRGVFRTQVNIYDEAFLWIYLLAYYFGNKSFIIDIRLGYIQVSENIEIFKLKLMLSKSSQLSQRVVFLV